MRKPNKFWVHLACCFIPSRRLRHKLRRVEKHFEFIGKNNRVFIGDVEVFNPVRGIAINIIGDNNIIKLPAGLKIHNSNIFINRANNCCISIAPTEKTLYCLNISAGCGNNQKLTIGSNFQCWGVGIQMNEENASVEIGDDCLFSNSISIWPTDGHAVIDAETNKVLNHIVHPVKIGNHCWVGEGVRFTKNASIPNNTIVGIGSVVTKQFDTENTIIAGNPAQVIKTGVDWSPINPYVLNKIQKGKSND